MSVTTIKLLEKFIKGVFVYINMKQTKDKSARKKELMEKYYCSIHGCNGDPNCSECWEKLKLLADDNNALLVGEDGKLVN